MNTHSLRWQRLRRAALVSLALALPTSVVEALEIYVSHEYGEFVDRGRVRIGLSPKGGTWIDCPEPMAVAFVGQKIILTSRQSLVPPPDPVPGQTCPGGSAMLPVLAAGSYAVDARLVDSNGAIVQTAAQTLVIMPIDGRCNADPELVPSLFGMLKTLSPATFADKLKSDPAYAAAMGHPTVLNTQVTFPVMTVQIAYPPLVDPTFEMNRLMSSGEFDGISRNGRGCFSAAPPDAVATFVEFNHPALDQYFYTGDASEIAAIDAGKVGPWKRTGKSFRATVYPGCAFSTTDTVVYRFSGTAAVGTGTHFFTRDRAECSTVDRSAKWAFEGLPMWASPVLPDGSCAAPFAQQRNPLYRLWRPFGDSNHRFTTERSVVNEMVAKGWVDEGAAMCVRPSN